MAKSPKIPTIEELEKLAEASEKKGAPLSVASEPAEPSVNAEVPSVLEEPIVPVVPAPVPLRTWRVEKNCRLKMYGDDRSINAGTIVHWDDRTTELALGQGVVLIPLFDEKSPVETIAIAEYHKNQAFRIHRGEVVGPDWVNLSVSEKSVWRAKASEQLEKA